MPPVSQTKRSKISEQILGFLFDATPEAHYSATIARELARDEEFIKSLLLELESKKLVVKITKNATGDDYIRRQRWRLSNNVFDAYRRMQR